VQLTISSRGFHFSTLHRFLSFAWTTSSHTISVIYSKARLHRSARLAIFHLTSLRRTLLSTPGSEKHTQHRPSSRDLQDCVLLPKSRPKTQRCERLSDFLRQGLAQTNSSLGKFINLALHHITYLYRVPCISKVLSGQRLWYSYIQPRAHSLRGLQCQGYGNPPPYPQPH